MTKLNRTTFIAGSALCLCGVVHAKQPETTPPPEAQQSTPPPPATQMPPETQPQSTAPPPATQQPPRTQQPGTPPDQPTSQSPTAGSTPQQGTGGQEMGATTPETSRQAAAGQPAMAGVPVLMMVVPVEVANASRNPAESGCWAQLYDDENYRGDRFTLVGPVDMPNMSGPFGVNWSDIDSIRTGPAATVTIYDNTNFRDRAAKIQSGQEIPELGEKLGFFEEVRSIQISCSPPARG